MIFTDFYQCTLLIFMFPHDQLLSCHLPPAGSLPHLKRYTFCFHLSHILCSITATTCSWKRILLYVGRGADLRASPCLPLISTFSSAPVLTLNNVFTYSLHISFCVLCLISRLWEIPNIYNCYVNSYYMYYLGGMIARQRPIHMQHRALLLQNAVNFLFAILLTPQMQILLVQKANCTAKILCTCACVHMHMHACACVLSVVIPPIQTPLLYWTWCTSSSFGTLFTQEPLSTSSRSRHFPSSEWRGVTAGVRCNSRKSPSVSTRSHQTLGKLTVSRCSIKLLLEAVRNSTSH